jgi:hypothetical protein
LVDIATDSGEQDQGEYALTTVDNPFNPFTQWDEWYAYDAMHGYHTPSFLARVALTSDDLSDADQAAAIQFAIQEIVKENVLGIYRKVSRSSFETLNQNS